MLYLQTPQFVLREMQREVSQIKTVRVSVDGISGDGSVLLPTLSALLLGEVGAPVKKDGAFEVWFTTDLNIQDIGAIRSETQGRMVLHETGREPIIGEVHTISEGERRVLWFDRAPTRDAILEKVLAQRWLSLSRSALNLPMVRAGFSRPVAVGAEENIRELFRKTRFFRFSERLPDARLNGVDTYTYAVTFRPEALRAFVIVLTSLREQRSLTAEELARLDQDLLRWRVAWVQLSIRKRDFVLTEMRMDVRYENAETASSMPVSLTLKPSRWNEPLAISFPKEAEHIRAVLRSAGVAGLSLAEGRPNNPGAPTSGDATSVGISVASSTTRIPADEDADQDGLTETLEAFYGTDTRNPDTDGDGYQDGYEVNHGFNPTGPGQLFGFGR